MVNEPEKVPRSRNTAFPSASFAICQLPERKGKKKNQERGGRRWGLGGKKKEGRMTQT